jgi:catechol 2,3-dioxygenase-like lactoylglutathione lyase family enzyme
MRLKSAMIFVLDLPRQEAFYRDILGLKPVEATRHPDWVEFEAGGAAFSLHAIPAHIAATITPSGAPREQDPVKLSFEVEDPAAEAGRLEALGVRILRRPWGACDGVDPEGNVFGIG